MIYIYQADSTEVSKKVPLVELLKDFPKFMHERALRYKSEQAGYNFIIGRMLLNEGLKKLGMVEEFEKIGFHPTGKPFLKKAFFNISHSDSKVVCAITTQGEIGLDIEKVKPIKLNNFNAFFTEKEWTEINSSASPLDNFYWFWTRKESIIKALGVNLSHLHKIEVDTTNDHFIENDKKWFLNDLDFGEGFCAALCSEFPIQEIHFVK